MTAMDEKTVAATTQKYLRLLTTIESITARLKWSEMGYIAMNLIVFFPTMFFVSSVFDKLRTQPMNQVDLLFMFLCHVIGMSINAYWTTSSMRLQLKLKLRYFQARFLERKLDAVGENLISDESIYFDPAIGLVKSPDGKESVEYPTKGALRMDGFVGAAKPRVLSLAAASVFFVIYLASFLTILLSLFSL